MNKKNGGPAFPQSGVCTPEIESWDSNDFGGRGLSIRDYFAAKAMQSIVSAPHQMEDLIDTLGASTAYAKVSETAFVIADAMLRAREAS